jgi:hypothetical protein
MNATSFDVIRAAISTLSQPTPSSTPKPRRLSLLAQRLSQIPETLEEIAKVCSALQVLSPNAPRGNGRLFDDQGQPVDDYWLGCVWAIRSLNWADGEELAREWSQGITRTPYCEDGFQEAWTSYDASCPNPVTIRSLFKRAIAAGWNQTGLNSPPTLSLVQDAQPCRYQLLSADDIAKLKPASWRVKSIFPEVGLGAIFGPSASGKSFLAFDLATSIASGEPWFGMKTRQSPVVYIMLEGEAGLQNRVTAWETAHNKALPPALKLILQPVDLMSWQDPADLLKVLPENAVIFIDTLNRASPTADENKSQDMGQIISQAKLLSAETSGLVILVHHTGKEAARGLRGHSSLFAALDGAIEVTRDNAGNRAWSVAKAKDGQDGIAHSFRLKVHTLGKDAEGDEMTSCSVERHASAIFIPSQPTGKNQKLALNEIKTALSRSTVTGKASSGTSRCIAVEAAIKLVASKLTAVEANKRTNQARTLIAGLISGGFINSGLESDEAWLW